MPPQSDTKWKKTFQKMKIGRLERFRNTLRQDGEMNLFDNDRGKCLAGEVMTVVHSKLWQRKKNMLISQHIMFITN
jgi:hypothetical protein